MLQAVYIDPDQEIFTIDRIPEKVISINDIRYYSDKEGLALNDDEIKYLEDLALSIDRPLDRQRGFWIFAGKF